MATTQSDFEGSVVLRFKQAMEALNPPLRNVRENVEHKFTKDDEWARITFRPASGLTPSYGTQRRRYRQQGTILVQIFTPADKSTKRQAELEEAVLSVFRSERRINGVKFSNAYPRRDGVTGNWMQSTAVITYQWDALR